jgi:sulfonate transport system substrate-binding protein
MARRLSATAILVGVAVLLGTAARAEIVLRMGDQKGNVKAVMEAAGVLGDLPYRLDWSEFPAAAPLLEAINAGVIDGGNVGDAPFTFGIAAGVPAKAISAVRQNQDGLAVLVTADSSIRSLDDLRGKRIATGRGSIGHYLILASLDRAGLPLDAIKLVFLTPADAKAAYARGSVDGWSTWEPYTSQEEVLSGARRAIDGSRPTPGLSFQVASVAAIREKREALTDFVRRMSAARRWSLENLDDYAERWGRLMDIPPAVPRQWFRRARIHAVPIDDAVVADEQRVIDLYAKAGLLRQTFDAGQALDRSFNDAIQLSEKPQ